MNKQNLLSTHNLFTLRLLLSLLGAYIGHTYRHTSHDYWFGMTFLFTVLAIAPGYYQFKQHRDNLKTFINQLLHWVGGLCAVIIIYAYHSSGRIFHEEAGLIVLLILALTTYLDGIKKDWRCIFVGLFLGLITVCVAYFDSYIWQLIVLAAAPLLTVITTLMNKPIGKGSLLFCLTGIVTMEFKVLLLSLLLSANSFAAEKTVIRIGVQSSGTVEWELPALQDELNAKQADVQLDIQHVANTEAGKIALQSGAVDIIVSDWIWVSGLREKGADFTFYPYSDISGALMVPSDSGIHSLQDLKGKRLGIAGGELDKNWLLLQTLAKQQDMDLDASVEKVFAAPPLLNEQIKQGRIDAVLNYWHFAARLEAEGYRTLIDGRSILQGLRISDSVANLGYIFKQSWADQHKQAIKQFFDAGKQAKQTLCSSDAAWQKIIPLTKIDDETTLKHLRQNYCAGNIEHWGEAEQKAAGKVYLLLHKQSKQALTGKSEQLQPGTFW